MLGDPGSAERITPPPLCSVHLTDGSDSCAAYIRGCTPGSREVQKRVFVSSTNVSSNLGGVTGADAACQALADGAGLVGDFRAWISDATQSPASRFVRSSVSYVRLDGAVAASNWPDLTDGSLQNPINVTETLVQSNEIVWTNTNAAGAVDNTDPAHTCQNWTSNSFTLDATVGLSDQTTAGWSSTGAVGICGLNIDVDRALYCFEQ